MSGRGSRSSRVHAVVVCALVALASLARAQRRDEPARAITVRGASSCVGAAALRGRIAHYLAAKPQRGEITIEVDLAGDPPGFRVLRAGSPIAERRFERLPAGCAERRDAIALTIAVAIEHAESEPAAASQLSGSQPSAAGTSASASPRSGSQPTAAATDGNATSAGPASQPSATNATPGSASSQAGPQPTAASATPPVPNPAALAPPAAANTTEPGPEPDPEPESDIDALPDTQGPTWQRPTERFMLYAGASYLVEALPSPAPVFALGAEYAVLPALRLSLSGLATTKANRAFETGRVESWLVGGAGYACLNAPVSEVILHACAGAAAALVRADGFDFTEEGGAEMAWVAGVLRLLVEVPANGTLALRLVGAGHVNLWRPTLSLERPLETPVTKPVGPLGASIGAEILVRVE